MKKLTKWFLGLAGTLLAVGLVLRGIGFVMGGRSESRRYFEDHMDHARTELEEYWGVWEPAYVGPGGVHVGGEDGIHVDPNGVHVGGENGIHVDSGGVMVGGENGISVGHLGKKQLLESGELTGITGVEAELNWGEIQVLEGETLSLSLEWNLSGYAMSYRVEKGVLKVEDGDSYSKNGDNFPMESRMILTVPEGMELDELELSTDLGDIRVDAALTAREAELSTDMGDVSCLGLLAVELEVQSELGDVSVTVPSECKNLSYSLSTGLGEVFVNGRNSSNPTLVLAPKQEHNLEASTDLGDVTLRIT